MGWAFCGTDSRGREIGYGISATCDFPGCEEEIDRGLGNACGGMHGENGIDCEGYFCGSHLYLHNFDPDLTHGGFLCKDCISMALMCGHNEIDYDAEDDDEC